MRLSWTLYAIGDGFSFWVGFGRFEVGKNESGPLASLGRNRNASVWVCGIKSFSGCVQKALCDDMAARGCWLNFSPIIRKA